MKIIPLRDKVLVKVDEAPKSTPGGLALPDIAQDKPQSGVVVGVGPGRRDENGKLHPVSISKGCHVIFKRFAGMELDDNLLLLSEDDLLGKVEQ